MNEEAVAAAWVRHLRAGGDTTWTRWRSHTVIGGSESVELPSVANLELLRRVGGFSEEILTAAPAGRGRLDLTLPGLGGDVAPEDLAPRDLFRVLLPVLADEAGRRVLPSPSIPARSWRTPRFVLAGCASILPGLRGALLGRGFVEGGRRPRVYVVVPTFDDAVAGLWRRRIERGSAIGWPRLWSQLAVRDELPLALQPAAIARKWSARVGERRVELVGADQLAQVVGDYLGVSVQPDPMPSAATLDLLRRLNPLLAAGETPAVARLLLRSPNTHASGDGRIVVPAKAREFADHAAHRIDAALSIDAAGQRIAPAATLALGIEILRGWAAADSAGGGR